MHINWKLKPIIDYPLLMILIMTNGPTKWQLYKETDFKYSVINDKIINIIHKFIEIIADDFIPANANWIQFVTLDNQWIKYKPSSLWSSSSSLCSLTWTRNWLRLANEQFKSGLLTLFMILGFNLKVGSVKQLFM